MLITAMAHVSVRFQCFSPESQAEQLPLFMQEKLMHMRTSRKARHLNFIFHVILIHNIKKGKRPKNTEAQPNT